MGKFSVASFAAMAALISSALPDQQPIVDHRVKRKEPPKQIHSDKLAKRLKKSKRLFRV